MEYIIINYVKEGSILEFGFFEGASINYMSSIVDGDRRLYGFDSFEGLPENWRQDYEKGRFALNQLPQVNQSDLYSSTKIVLQELENHIVSGTIILFDEFFNYPNWKNGEYRAFMEFTEKTKKEFEYIGYCYQGYQVAVRIL
jgi:predicted O-methyltransferase YrrM